MSRGEYAELPAAETDTKAEHSAVVEARECSVMRERLTPHIASLIRESQAGIAAQYREESDKISAPPEFSDADPLGEDSKFSPLKGIVHKFENRVLWKV